MKIKSWTLFVHDRQNETTNKHSSNQIIFTIIGATFVLIVVLLSIQPEPNFDTPFRRRLLSNKQETSTKQYTETVSNEAKTLHHLETTLNHDGSSGVLADKKANDIKQQANNARNTGTKHIHEREEELGALEQKLQQLHMEKVEFEHKLMAIEREMATVKHARSAETQAMKNVEGSGIATDRDHTKMQQTLHTRLAEKAENVNK